MDTNSIVIWGAGRIGRGFIGDLFFHAGYQLVFVDESEDLVEQLKKSGKYSIVRAINAEFINRVEITGYQALITKQKKEISDAVCNSDLIATAVYPKFFKNVASDISKCINFRKEHGNNNPINILLCTNLVHAGPTFKSYLYNNLTKEQAQYFDENVGVVESLVIRIAPDPPQSEIEKDQLVVWTNGYPELPVEEAAFKGNIPKIESLRLVKDMRAEETRKIYTYNMFHAVLSYHGHMRGYQLLVECLDDPNIHKEAYEALDEVSQALQKEYGFTSEEMNIWVENVISHTDNPSIGDKVIRSAADPARKLKRNDRLVGPALLCRKHDIEPKALIRGIAAALLYINPEDAGANFVQDVIRTKGIQQASIELCSLNADEQDFVRKILLQYQRLRLENEWWQRANEAYKLGFQHEKIYHGCGQCVLAALMDVLDTFNEEVFNAATGLNGGIGLVGDATCSAYIGGAMIMGLLFPRRRENFDADRQNKYKTFHLIQALRQKFINEYGSITCHDIHRRIYGRSFDLREGVEREKFEEAGAHKNGCTEIVGKTAKWTVEIISESLIKDELKE
ncbi:MAG TPA: hypothetical protein G4N92_00760 [Anaerolineae bacterium]|nr:hypothetical protein [Anaerolineae bacterium]